MFHHRARDRERGISILLFYLKGPSVSKIILEGIIREFCTHDSFQWTRTKKISTGRQFRSWDYLRFQV